MTTEWQPIKTAPKDGTAVLLWWPDWTSWPSAGRFNEELSDEENQWELLGQQSPRWCAPPTHWMTMPSPPAAGE